MNSFAFANPSDIPSALKLGGTPGSAFLAGGTTVIDIWKLGAFPATQMVDINSLALRGIEAGPGILKLGALERMADVGSHPDVVKNFPVVSQALLLSASPQIRNMGTMGGNLLQRPRSISYRNPNPNLRDGPSRFDAIFGVTSHSAAPHPSDLAVALMALDASVRVQGPSSERLIKLSDFYKIPQRDLSFSTLASNELITALEAQVPFAHRSAYVKIRDRASYQFAIVAAAVVLDLDGANIREARVAAGGVGTIPWRLPQVEAALKGRPATLESFQAALAEIGPGAVTHSQNVFKVELLRRTVLRALLQAKEIA